MTTINVKGSIVDDSSAWLYEWFGIQHTTAKQFKAQLEAATDDVVVEINSPGGYVSPAAEIYEAIRTYPGSVECRVVGQAASAASIIACAAPSSITPMGTLFLHNCIGYAEGNHNAMRQSMHAMESVDENIMEAYRAKTGLTDAEIYGLMEENTTLSAKRAVELGFIDRITESAADIAQTAGEVAGIAASANGFVDLMAMDADRLAAMRELYEDFKAGCEGGETMEIEEIQDADEQVAESDPEAVDEEPVADDADEVELADDGQGEDGAAEDAADDADADGDDVEDEAADEPDDVQAAYDRGVFAERDRIEGILAIAARVPDAMVRAALFTEPISAEQLALQAMRAEDAERTGYMGKARADVDASRSAEVAAEVTDEGAAPDEVQALAAKMKERY